ncbi:MAG: GIY-YIG nuclease family protein [Phycisphaerales bacterium]|nr:MAG: GIY-YIG nuclease family protein [Phycisphaerales bacterium]
MAKFSALFESLRESGETEVEMAFGEVEGYVGQLPRSAHKYEAYWYNMTRDLADTGYRVKRVRLDEKTVTFYRAGAIPAIKGEVVDSRRAPEHARVERSADETLPTDALARLLDIGFQSAGDWTLQNDELCLGLDDKLAERRNVLYSFVVDGQLCYVGKTTNPLGKRLYFYKNPGPTQSTNIKNNQRIREALAQGKTVEIYALADSGLLRYGGFHVNLAAGLEDSIVKSLKPVWNSMGN